MNKNNLHQTLLQDSNILIVDDNETTRLILRSFCEHEGFKHIAEAKDGREALEYIIARKPDLVFLDMKMPEMDGIALCRDLARRELLQDLIVIMQTSITSSEFKAQAFEAGITDLINKPLEQRETMARTFSHLERRFLSRKIDLDYKRIQAELNEAMMLQNILLPKEEIISKIQLDLKLDIAHYYHPATELAGDYLSVRRLSEERVALASVDISGHGLTVALYAFSIHTLLQDESHADKMPNEILSQLNNKLHGFMNVGKFATMFLAIIDTKQKQLYYASAASPPPVMISEGQVQTLQTHGYLLGVQESAKYEHFSIPYQPGDVLFIYSDALIETTGKNGKNMNQRDIVDVLLRKPYGSSSQMLKEMLVAFYDGSTQPPSDDLSMLACRF